MHASTRPATEHHMIISGYLHELAHDNFAPIAAYVQKQNEAHELLRQQRCASQQSSPAKLLLYKLCKLINIGKLLINGVSFEQDSQYEIWRVPAKQSSAEITRCLSLFEQISISCSQNCHYLTRFLEPFLTSLETMLFVTVTALDTVEDSRLPSML